MEVPTAGALGVRGYRRKTETVNNIGKNLALWMIIALLLIALFNLFQSSLDQGSN